MCLFITPTATRATRKTSGIAQVSAEDQKRLKENWNKPAGDQPILKGIQMMSLLETVNELHQKGYIDQAVETLLNAIGAVPEEKKLYLALAEISISLRRYQDAIDTLNEMPADAKTEMDSEETGHLNESGFEPPSLVVSENYEMKTLEILGYAEEGPRKFRSSRRVCGSDASDRSEISARIKFERYFGVSEKGFEFC